MSYLVILCETSLKCGSILAISLLETVIEAIHFSIINFQIRYFLCKQYYNDNILRRYERLVSWRMKIEKTSLFRVEIVRWGTRQTVFPVREIRSRNCVESKSYERSVDRMLITESYPLHVSSNKLDLLRASYQSLFRSDSIKCPLKFVWSVHR